MFIRESNRLRAYCNMKNKETGSSCKYGVNVRFGEQRLEGEVEPHIGWHVTKIKKHNCNVFRSESSTLYSNYLLARSLFSKTTGLRIPSVAYCKSVLRDITLREISRSKVYRTRKVLEELILGRKDTEV